MRRQAASYLIHNEAFLKFMKTNETFMSLPHGHNSFEKALMQVLLQALWFVIISIQSLYLHVLCLTLFIVYKVGKNIETYVKNETASVIFNS